MKEQKQNFRSECARQSTVSSWFFNLVLIFEDIINLLMFKKVEEKKQQMDRELAMLHSRLNEEEDTSVLEELEIEVLLHLSYSYNELCFLKIHANSFYSANETWKCCGST